MSEQVVIVGCGLFGSTAALELARRGRRVRVLEASVAPAPLAASTDISKLLRLEYGDNQIYTALAERALGRWAELNEAWQREGRPRLFHDVGLLLVCRDEMRPGGFEYQSFQTLLSRGHAPERLGGEALAQRFPAWSPSLRDGFLQPRGGYIESAGVVWALTEAARDAGAEILSNCPAGRIVTRGDRVVGVEDTSGALHVADRVLVAAGSWSQEVMPELRGALRRHYHPVWYLRPSRPELFRAERFPAFTADISNTGYYGFPLHPVHAVVKVGHHGRPVEPAGPDAELTPPAGASEALRGFLSDALPPLADAEIVHSTLCPYSDTADEHFWIGRSPDITGLTVAAGGSGHAFKFAPLLGEWIADTVEHGKIRDDEHDVAALWRWRSLAPAGTGIDPSRCRA